MQTKEGSNMSTKKTGVDQQLIRDLAGILNDTNLSEIEVEFGDLKVRVSRQPAAVHAVAPPTYVAAAPQPAHEERSEAHEADLLDQPLGELRARQPPVLDAVGAAEAFVGGDVLLIQADGRNGSGSHGGVRPPGPAPCRPMGGTLAEG